MKLRLSSLFVASLFAFTFHLPVSAAEPAKPEKAEKPAEKPTDKAGKGDKPAGKTGAGEITDPAAALAGIPREVMQDLRPGSRKMEAAAGKASEVVAKNIEKKEATYKLTIRTVEKSKPKDSPDEARYRIFGANEKIRENGVTLDVVIMAMPDASEDAKVAKLQKGDKIIVTGQVSNGEITGNKTAVLHINLNDAKLK